ncbi:YadA-like family protein [Burkholderia semiarida]|uniref:YadA-like family protein n=1 Tax=Burkholderia semiarida TaxID=2843303 RepID=A0ABW7L9Y5_9BURK
MTNHRITNLANGTAGTDAVNLNQLNAAIAVASDDPYVKVNSTGTAAAANGADSIAIGAGSNVRNGSSNSIALGNGATVNSSNRYIPVNGIAIGNNARVVDGDIPGATGAIALGDSATASGIGAITIGANSRNTNSYTTALGANTLVTGGGSTALGANATATGGNSLALGVAATSSVSNGVALGAGSVATRANSVSVGSATQQRQIVNVAAGTQGTDAVNVTQLNTAIAATNNPRIVVGGATDATVSGRAGNIAIGSGANSAASALTSASIALGDGASSTSAGTVAVGSNSNASGWETVALGLRASATGAMSVVVGGDASATADNAVALGTSSVADRANSVSIGSARQQRQIVNVAAGTQDTDAVNLGQLNAAIAAAGGGGGATDNPYVRINSTGAGAAATGSNAIGIGMGASAGGPNAIAMGNGARTNSIGLDFTPTGAIAIGNNAAADAGALNGAISSSSVAVGSNTAAYAAGSVAIGDAARASVSPTTGAVGDDANFGVSIGQGAVSGNGGTAIGYVSRAMGNYGTALGERANVDVNSAYGLAAGAEASVVGSTAGGTTRTANNSVALGRGAHVAATSSANADDSVAIGSRAGVTASNAVALGAGSVADTADTVSVGNASAQRRIVNLAAGTADTDAVNVSQLKGSGLIGDDGRSIAAVTYDRHADGTPNYGSVTLGNGTGPAQLKNVADATDDHDALNLGQLKGTGLVGEDGSGNLTSLAVTYDDATKAGVTLGNAGMPVALHNVAAGDLSATSTDAVNGSQLYVTNTRVGSLEDSLKNGGVIDPTTGESLAVVYDSAAKNHVTLGGAGAAAPVTLSNVAAGVAATDAVNVQQLQQTVATGNPYIGGRGTGVAAQATGINAVALGLGSVANEINTISVGNDTTGLQRRITNVQNGQADSDAATVGQVNDLIGVTTTTTQAAIDGVDTKTQLAIQDVNNRLDSIATTAGTDPYVQVDGAGDGSDNASVGAGTFGVAIGAEASATGTTAIAIGPQAVSSGTGSVALGAGASATANGAVAFGSGRATGTSALALGNGTVAGGNNAVAAGFNAQAAGLNALALGNTSRANAADSMAFGTAAQVDPLATNAIAIGRQASVTSAAQNAVALGSNSVADRLNSVSVGSTGQQRQIIYVARGTANTDAVNVSQLKDAMSAFGGNAGVGADGSITNPTYTVGGATYRNVGDALDALAQLGGGADPLAVTYGTNPDGSPNFEVVALKGANGTKLSNVAAGDVNATSTDAINGSQLYATNQDIGDLRDSLKDGGVIDPVTGESLAVVYDGAAKDTVTLKGTDGTTLTNVKAGVADMDAVNVSQLKGSGLIGDDGKAIAAVTYDRNADGTPNYGSVTLGDGVTPTKLSNVADATGDHDALNLGQLKDTGLVGDDGSGNLTSLAVTYDDATKAGVTLGNAGTPVAIHNVAAGDVSATSTDAINGSQLYATNQDIGDLRDSLKDGGVIDPTTGESLAVVYDSASKDKVTLGGAAATAPVTLTNVAAGKGDTDAVNVGQLKDTGLVGDDGSGNLTSLAVTYDDAAKNAITLGNAGTPVAIHNVAAGDLSATSTDAVNGSQLFATNTRVGSLEDSLKDGGVIDPTTGESLAVVYDSAAKNHVTLGGAGAANPVVLSNVAKGVAGTDAVNVDQLTDAIKDLGTGTDPLAVSYDTIAKDRVTLGGTAATAPVTLTNVAAGGVNATSTDAINGSQLHGTAQSVADALGGGSTVGADGKATAPTYSLADPAGGTTPVDYHNVGDALANLDGRTSTNTGDIADIRDRLGNSGLFDPTTGESLAVVYDSAAKDKVTLGGATATAPVTLTNVAAGKGDTDAVNVGQLKDSGLVGDDGSGNLTSLAVTYDDAAKNAITLGNAGTPVAIHNVAAGDLSATSTDAVNGSQLFATNQDIGDLRDSLKDGGVIDPTTGESLAVVYDSTAKNQVTLGGAGATAPVQLKNVAAGTDDTDAVNVAQLKDAGLVAPVDPTDPSTGLTSLAVTYGTNADGSANFDEVKLKGTNGTTLTNVAAGAVSATSMDAINGSQLHGTAQSVADALGGGSTVAADGKVTAPTYSLADPAGGTTPVDYHNVGDALANLDSRTSTNTGDISDLKDRLSDSGLVDANGNTLAAVTYDQNGDGTPNYGSVTLGGAKATGPVALHNVAAGDVSATSTDAINGSQLYATNQDIGDLRDSLKDGGVIDPTTGESLAVVYDGTAKNQVTLGGAGATTPVQLKNVAAGKDDTDAVNVGQLKDSGLVGDDGRGNLTSLAVTYDDGAKTAVTLGNAGMPVAIRNVAAGDLSATSTDAVNGSQLYATNTRVGSLEDSLRDGGVIDPTTGESLAVVYDSTAKNQVTLGGAGATTPVQLKNVAAGTDDTDAVNVAQLKDAGLVAPVDPTDPGTGLTSLAVTYGTNADGSANFGEVKLKGTDGTTLTNVAAGAVNATSMDAINGSQLHGTAQSVADTIGGGTTVDADGKLANTAIEVNGQKYSTVEQAVQAAAAYGATDSLAVRYDLNRDGSPNYGSVTLGGTGAAPVTLTNVADGANRYDAVNYGQLSALRDQFGDLDGRVGALEQNPGNGGGGGGGSGDNPYFAGTDIDPAASNPANAGTGTGNTAAGSGATIGSGANNATVIGSNAKSSADGATAIGSGANASGGQSVAIGDGANASGSNSVALGAGSVAAEANTVSFGNGTDDGNRRIVNIADGMNASDAATKGQLDRAVGGLQGQINDVSKNAYSGIAAATALTMIPGVDPGKTLSFGVGGATYKGYQAVAFGGEARITQNLKMKAGVGLSSGGNTVGVGASYQW